MNEEQPTVLVVDDDQQLLSLYRHYLDGRYRVLTAHAGTAALDLVDDAVDVVVLDRRMPGTTGDEVLEALRGRGYDGPVAMVTAVNPDTDIVDMPFDDYLVKPVTRDELDGLIRRLIRRAAYDEGVREFFAVASKRAALEAELTAAELEDDEEYQRLVDRLDDLRDDARISVDGLSQEAVEPLFRDLDAPPTEEVWFDVRPDED